MTSSVFFGDFDNDGDQDWIAMNTMSASSSHNLYINGGTGSFSNSYFGDSNNNTISGIGDTDGDGDIDIYYYKSGDTRNKCVNNGSATFSCVQETNNAGDDLTNVLFGDFNNDGSLDAVETTASTLSTGFLKNTDRKGTLANQNGEAYPGFVAKSLAYADMNSDGYLDFVGIENGTNHAAVYLNSGTGSFTQSYIHSTQSHTAEALGDFDGDGNIDIVVASTGKEVFTLKNNGIGTSFTEGTHVSVSDTINAISVADLDNDGDLDIIIAQNGTLVGGSRTYLNDGFGNFTVNGVLTESSDQVKSLGIADIDNDGDLDYVRGSSTFENRIYGSDQAATSPNTAPTASSTFTGAKISDNGSIATVRLSWGSGSDTETATKLLQYQLKVGTGSNTNNIVSGATSSPSWVTRLMPNGQSRTYLIKNLPCDNTFYWNVAAVDTGFKTTWGTEQSFTLDSSCNYTAGGGGGGTSGGGGGSTGGGGGWSWNYLRQGDTPSVAVPSEKADLIIQAFNDISGNGLRESRESSAGFKNLPVTIQGMTDAEKAIEKTIGMDEQGMVSVKIRPGTYTITVDSESLVVKDKKSTTSVVFDDVSLVPGGTTTLTVGFQDTALLRHQPCLSVGVGGDEEGTDAEVLLRRLENNYGQSIVEGVSLTEPLVTRQSFFRLISAMHCIDLSESEETLKQKLRETFNLHTVPGWTSIELRDLPLAPLLQDAKIIYALLADGVPVVRSSTNGPLADLQSPMSRSDAVRIVSAIMQIPDEKRATAGILPRDLDVTDPILSDLFTLQSFHIVPQSFLPVFGAQQGMTLREAAYLLDLSAFSAGKINLFVDFGKTGTKDNENFLERELPNFALPSAVLKDSDRANSVTFNDILPGDPLFHDLQSALAFGTKNRANETLWLIPGTQRTAEFGVEKGQTALRADEPATLLETLRSLLVLSGLPPPTRAAVVSGTDKRESEGSGEQRVPLDLLVNLPRDGSFASRVLYRAQDTVRTYNVSLVTYIPWLLHQSFQSPSSQLTIEEAADLFASMLIRNSVVQGEVPSQDGDKNMQSLRQAIAEDLLGTTLDWQTANKTKNIVFTKGMLTHLLGTIVQTASNGMHQDFTSEESPGMAWWLRLR